MRLRDARGPGPPGHQLLDELGCIRFIRTGSPNQGSSIFKDMISDRDSPNQTLKLDDSLGVDHLFQLRFLVTGYAAA
jgi:hypothetical protein